MLFMDVNPGVGQEILIVREFAISSPVMPLHSQPASDFYLPCLVPQRSNKELVVFCPLTGQCVVVAWQVHPTLILFTITHQPLFAQADEEWCPYSAAPDL